MKYLLTIIGIIAAMGIGGMLFAWSGLYDISAAEPHWDATESLIETLRDRSITVHSKGIQTPDLDDPEYLMAAAGHYHGMCRLCHGAPGAHTNEFARGLYPSPPDFTTGAVQDTRSSAEIYWIVKNGIKMTGMPAFGPTHDETELWGLVAFTRELNEMSAEAYARVIGEHDETTVTGHSHAGSDNEEESRASEKEHSHDEKDDHAH